MPATDQPAPDQPLSASLGASPLFRAAVLQDHLLSARHDLERLERLLNDACETLLQGFQGAAHQLEAAMAETPASPVADSAKDNLQETVQSLYRTVTALQFQDMATQLIQHTSRRLRNCADQLAQEAMGQDPDGDAVIETEPQRPNPVTQDEMDAGSVELF